MNRDKQIKEAARTATNHSGSTCNNYAYLNFIEGAVWADAHPAPFTPETHLGRERLGQMRKLWATAYEHLIEVAMEENHTPAEVAKIFFELGFRAADEHPLIRKE